jgi:hypothetical protein
MTHCILEGDQLEHAGVYKCADGKAVSVYLAAAWPWVHAGAASRLNYPPERRWQLSAIFWTRSSVQKIMGYSKSDL